MVGPLQQAGALEGGVDGCREFEVIEVRVLAIMSFIRRLTVMALSGRVSGPLQGRG